MKRAMPVLLFSIGCGVILGLNSLLTRLVGKTSAIEHLMGGQVEDWVILLVGSFLILRFLAYLVLPGAIIASAVYHLARWIQRKAG